MHNGQILPLICDSAFCAEGGVAHDQRCGSGTSERCGRPSRGGASAVSFNHRCKLMGPPGGASSWARFARGKPCINPQARAPWGPPGCKHHGAHPEAQTSWDPPGGASVVNLNRRRKRCGSSLMWGHRRCGSPFMQECQWGSEKIARRRKAPSLARPNRSAFLSGKPWQYFVAMHSRRGATGRETPSRIRHRLRGR